MISGSPNSGKSSLATAVTRILGLGKVRTSSQLLWFYRDDPPYINDYHWTNDSVYSEEGFQWEKLGQSFSSVASTQEMAHSILIVEGHRIFDFKQCLGHVTTTVFLVYTSGAGLENH